MSGDPLESATRDELIGRVQQLEQQLRWFQKQLFGAKSERRIVESSASQLSLGEILAPAADVPKPKLTVRNHVRTKGALSEPTEEPGLRFEDCVPVETIEIPNPELEGLAEEDLTLVQEKRTYRLAQRPASYVVLEIVRKVVKRMDTKALCCPPAAPAVLEKSYADVSLLAGMLVDKFRYHLPLYRQHQRMSAAGVTVSRSSLTAWVKRSIELLAPIYTAQLESILESRVIAMDETPIRAGRKARGKMRTAYFWPIYGDRDEVAFPYSSTRAKRSIEQILGEFDGTLLSDGYVAYERYAQQRKAVVHARCWSHTRRGFIDAETLEPARSEAAIAQIRDLYAIEAECEHKRLEGSEKLQVRAEKSRPIVDQLFEWLESELARSALLPSNPFTKAAKYALDRKAGLEVFLSDPDVPLDTNHLERALRVIPMGRRNWLFCWTEIGAQHVGQIQSLLVTCVLHGVDPYSYLVDVLQRIDRHPQSEVENLTPRLWKELFADNPLRSMLDTTTPARA